MRDLDPAQLARETRALRKSTTELWRRLNEAERLLANLAGLPYPDNRERSHAAGASAFAGEAQPDLKVAS
jgi:hypothetical protein